MTKQTEKYKHHTFPLYTEYKKQNKTKNQAQGYRELIGGCQKWGQGVGEMDEGGQNCYFIIILYIDYILK